MKAAVEWLKGILGITKPGELVLTIPTNPAELDDEGWFEAFKSKNEAEYGDGPTEAALCPWPGCEGHMLNGPSGGMSVNIKCDTCDRKWNLMAMIGRMERLK